ncbi:MAG TPA: phosphoenolpyruvate--protein phosphotransferase [Candidatus Ozemobacteraceae bacterium]|nr:phosphoenolpyruvate--protein phosphotransferase [Candidatus Ozemobacteraceae bacterium]
MSEPRSPIQLSGIAGSTGVCHARAYVYRRRIDVVKTLVPPEHLDRELERLEAAITLTRQDILAAQKEALEKHGEKYAAIFESHLLMLTDPQFKPQMVRRLKAEKVNVESIVRETVDALQAAFSAIEDPYLRERAIDIKDVGDRLLRHLMGLDGPAKEIGDEPFVLLANEVTPSELLDFAKGKLRGVCLESGGVTSHAAILAGALGIPSVFGLVDLARVAHTGDSILVDTRQGGRVILHPAPDQISAITAPTEPPGTNPEVGGETTRDGVRLALGANIARVEELKLMTGRGIHRVGLFRSEFLFMESMDLPSEQFQESIYRQVVDAAPDMTVLRTMDIGSDKPVKYIPFPHEVNPAMGFRSIRFLLSRPDVLEPQLRAMVRAGDGRNCRIIFPMVSTPAELEAIAAIWKRVLDQISPSKPPEWGIMVEVPSAMFMMEQIARHTRYISIGTNDLLQFFYGIDRTNERLTDLANPLCIPFLRLLFYCVAAARGEGIKVGLCGEMAASPAGFLTLAGIGIEEMSMRPSAVTAMRRMIPKIILRDIVICVQELLAEGRQVDPAAEYARLFPDLAGDLKPV